MDPLSATGVVGLVFQISATFLRIAGRAYYLLSKRRYNGIHVALMRAVAPVHPAEETASHLTPPSVHSAFPEHIVKYSFTANNLERTISKKLTMSALRIFGHGWLRVYCSVTAYACEVWNEKAVVRRVEVEYKMEQL